MSANDVLRARLLEVGFPSATAFVDARPDSSLESAARELAHPAISSIVLEHLLVEESIAECRIESCAREILFRNLRDWLPDGWPREWREMDDILDNPLFHRAMAFHGLQLALPDEYGPAVDRVRRAMETSDIPMGWRPAGRDDPSLSKFFAAHWRIEQRCSDGA